MAVLAVTTPALADGPRNHITEADGPYLRLHAPDPVHWRKWEPAALAEAKRLGRPILLSIGYSACHYCHVMQKESFSDTETADIINKMFFPIIIDREERPDIDSLFQTAGAVLQLPTGWPLTMFLTPDGKPFWGGTYFPKDAVGGMAPFKQILRTVSALYREDPKGIAEAAARVADVLRQQTQSMPGTVTVDKIDGAAESFLTFIDPFSGGFGEAPKFPHLPTLELLWRAYLRTDTKAHADAVTMSLDEITKSGLYDHLGGGFYRYAVDAQWRIPHYEKMLDVNASFLGLMTDVWRETRSPLLERKIRETAAFLLRELRLTGGAFAGSLDADSKAENGAEEEGAFYTWTPKKIVAVLGDEAPLFRKMYAIGPSEAGEPDMGTLLETGDDVASIAKEMGAPVADIRRRIDSALRRLNAQRSKRHRPRRDEKVLADWNAMAARSLVEAGLALDEGAWVVAGRRAFDFAAQALTDKKGRLRQTWDRGRTGPFATLEGLARMAAAALTLFEATGDTSYLKQAEAWADMAVSRHWDAKDGGFFAAADDSGPLVVRTKPVFDEPNASGNAVMVEVLARLYYLTGNMERRQRADQILRLFGGAADKPILHIAGFLNGAETHLAAVQVVIIGDRTEDGTQTLFRHTVRTSLPTRVLQVIGPGTPLPDGHPAQYKTQMDGKATAYVCRGPVCSLPATTPADLGRTLAIMRQSVKRRAAANKGR